MPWKSLKHALLFNAFGTALLGLLMIGLRVPTKARSAANSRQTTPATVQTSGGMAPAWAPSRPAMIPASTIISLSLIHI